jgi:hypothetical protein
VHGHFFLCVRQKINKPLNYPLSSVCMYAIECVLQKFVRKSAKSTSGIERERDRERNARFIRFMYISCQWCECHSNAVECECIKTFNTNPAPSDPVYYACPRECRSRATFGELCYELIMWEFPLWLTWCSLESA